MKAPRNPHRSDTRGERPDLESWLDEQCRVLPDLPAPPTLIPRVMAALREREARSAVWWRRPWWDWPRAAQAASLVLLSLAIGLLGWTVVEVREALLASYWQHALSEWRGQFAPLLQIGHALGGVVATLARHLKGTVGMVLMGALIALYLTCIALGTLLFRLLRSHPTTA